MCRVLPVHPPVLLLVALAAAASGACTQGSADIVAPSAQGAASSVSLAIDEDYLLAAVDGVILRYDRETATVDELPAPGLSTYGVGHIASNATRVYFPTEDGLASLPREGGAVRVESDAPEGCFGSCTALTDDTLYVSAGNASEGGELLVYDLDSGDATVRQAPWGVSLAADQDTVFGVSCYETWSIPRDGGVATTWTHAELWGEDRGPDCPSSLVADDAWLYYAGFDGVVRTDHDWQDPELLVAYGPGGGRNPIAVRNGELYVSAEGEIRRVSGGTDAVLVEAGDIAGIAVGGDTLYWTVQTGTGGLEFFEVELD